MSSTVQKIVSSCLFLLMDSTDIARVVWVRAGGDQMPKSNRYWLRQYSPRSEELVTGPGGPAQWHIHHHCQDYFYQNLWVILELSVQELITMLHKREAHRTWAHCQILIGNPPWWGMHRWSLRFLTHILRMISWSKGIYIELENLMKSQALIDH